MGLALAGSAIASDVEVNNKVEVPLKTSAPDNVSPGNITITGDGKIVVDAGPAITIDSSNSVTLKGAIEVSNPENAVGVRIQGGNTGSFLSEGTITLQSKTADTDPRGTGKVGIEVVGPGAFTGNIEFDTGAAVQVQSDDGVGVALRTQMIGDFLGNGQISVDGENTVGLLVAAPVQGDINMRSTNLGVSGEGSAGVEILSDVSGGFRNQGYISTIALYQGYTIDDSEGDVDLPSGRGGVLIGGSLGTGFLNDGTEPANSDNTPGTAANIGTRLAPFAVQISPDIAGGQNGNIVLGNVSDQVGEGYGFVNRGGITASGSDGGQEVTAVDIRGSADGTFTTTVETGLRNLNSIAASTFDAAHAIGLTIGRGAIVDTILNEGTLSASNGGETGGQARGILIEDGGLTTSLLNTGTLTAQAGGANADAIAVEDRAGTLTSIINRGTLSAYLSSQKDIDVPDNAITDAINLSASSQDVAIVNEQYMSGDIRLGAGNDLVHLTSFYGADTSEDAEPQYSVMLGSIFSGGGNDTVLIDSGARFAGGIVNEGGGTVDLQFLDGTLGLSASSTLNVTTATFGENSTTTIYLDKHSGDTPRITVTDLATVENGATFDLRFQEFLGSSAEITLIDAGTLNNASDLFTGDLFYLYNGEIKVSEADTSDIVLSLDLKTPEQLGLNGRQARSFPAFVEILDLDPNLASAIGNLDNGDAFLSAYDQLLPTGGLAARAAAIAVTDQTAQAIGQRLDALRRVSHKTKATAWFQIFGSYYIQDPVEDYVGFDGETYGIAGGFDFSSLGADALGLSFSWSGSTITDDNASADEKFRVDSIQLGAYGSWSVGPAFLALHGAGGYNKYRTDRFVIIGEDFTRTPKADWDGYQYSGSARLGLDGKFGHFRITPSAGLDYLYVNQNGFGEAGGGNGINLTVSESDFTSFRASGELELAYSIKQSNGSRLTPSIRGGIRQEFETDPLVTQARFSQGSQVFEIISGEIPDSGVLGGVGIAYDINSFYGGLHLEAGYTGLVEEDFMRHSGGVNFRFTF